MKNSNNNIESLFTKILKEEINKKSKSMSNKFGEWTEIDTNEELHGNQKKLDVAKPKGKLTRADFLKLQNKKKEDNEFYESDYDLDEESETYEGNAFTGDLDKARDNGDKEFEVDGETYNVHETLKLTETELIDLIESLVIKQMNEVSDSDNIKGKTPEGLKKTQKVQKETQKSNDDYAKEVMDKMKKYLKNGSEGEYSMDPKHFPKGNGELGEMKKKAYRASGAVEEYIENFARSAGLDELVYDEIKPNEDWVKDNIKGSSRTGNNPKWANAVETELGEKIFKKSQKKPYSTEKREGSYKRQTQPVDTAGKHEGKKSIDDMFAKLESKEDKKRKLVSEELNKIKDLYTYNRKTQ
jgi:hypothetical protein